MFSFAKLDAQLYSSGNSTITGNKVGVANNNPSAALEVSTNTINPNTAPTGVGYSMFNNPFKVQWKERVLVSGELSYYTNQEKTAFIVKNSGKVGVHTDNPEEDFHVKSNMKVGTNNWTAIKLDGKDNNDWLLNAHNDGERFYIRGQYNNAYPYRLTIMRSTGYVGINTYTPQAQLDVNGNVIISGDITIKGNYTASAGNNEIKLNANTGQIRAREVKVDLVQIPDYVFAADYNLMPLEEVKTFIEENQHLPNVKSEKEFKEEGSISLNKMNMKLLEKVEELTLYILQQEERIKALENGGVK